MVQEIDHGYRRFLVKRTDGSIRDFSWRKCLTPKTQKQEVRAVMRSLIEPQIVEFRDYAFAAGSHPCPITGELITKHNAHIDHAAPDTFQSLADRWLKLTGITEEDIELVYSPEYQSRTDFADRWLASDWIEFHREKCRLRAVSPTANLSTLRRTA